MKSKCVCVCVCYLYVYVCTGACCLYVCTGVQACVACMYVQARVTCMYVRVFRCVCRAGFDGPRCQQTRHSFSGGDTWSLYPALSPCSPSHTSLELMTQHDNAVVLYHGPVTDHLQPGHATDFILLEMRNGYPMLRVDHGSGLYSSSMSKHHVVTSRIS